MQALDRGSQARQRGESTADEYLERRMQALVGSMPPWKAELASKRMAASATPEEQHGTAGTVVRMREPIRRLSDEEVDGDEGWIRETDEPELRNVEASRDDEYWQVTVWVAEFLREEPLEGELRREMAAALSAVAGVDSVQEEDREIWNLQGSPSGEELLQAAAAVVDALADRARSHLNSLGG